MSRARDAVAAALWVLAPVGAIVALHRLGEVRWLQVDWSLTWLQRTPLVDVAAAGLRIVALAGAYWLAVSTLAYLLARVSGIRPLISTTRMLALPPVRRVADRLVAGTLAVSTMAAPMVGASVEQPPAATGEVTTSPAGTVAPDYPPVPLVDAEPPADDREEPADPPQVDPAGLPPPAARTPDAPAEEEPAITIRLDASLEVVVRPGDHLWALAERRLGEAWGRAPGDHEVAPYWVAVIDANRDRLRSGDPDLIYPGEVIVLPPVEDETAG